MKSETLHTRTEDETIALGRRLARQFTPGVVLLIGQLGAGKTTLAKGIVEEWCGVDPAEVSSPTFTLIHPYEGRERTAFHIDLYRLDEPQEVEALGLRDLFNSDALVLIEWGERFPELMPENRIEIHLQTEPDGAREIRIDERCKL